MTQMPRRHGFTLIELMLSMAFISILILAIASVTIKIGNMYNRGLVLKAVNQAGRDIDNTIRRDFLQSRYLHIHKVDDTNSVIKIDDAGQMRSGRFCLGNYSYLWNTPEVLDKGLDGDGVVYDPDGNRINFVRVTDRGAALCQPDASGYENELTADQNITHLLKSQSDEDDVVLSIHSMAVTPVVAAEGASEGLYRLQMTIGTSKLGELDTMVGQCKPPSDNQSNFDFCAINQFDTIVRTNG